MVLYTTAHISHKIEESFEENDNLIISMSIWSLYEVYISLYGIENQEKYHCCDLQNPKEMDEKPLHMCTLHKIDGSVSFW